MHDLAVNQKNVIVISDSTKELIRAGVSHNTLKAYGWALQRLEEWLAIDGTQIDRCGPCRVSHSSS